MGNTKGRQSYVRFVYKGECVLVQEIYVKKSKKLKLRAISVPDCHNPPSQVTTHNYNMVLVNHINIVF